MPVTRTPTLLVSDRPGLSFFRKVRNFMCNWEVSGGSFSFDGYRVRLRVNAQAPAITEQKPWELYQENATSSPLQVSMIDGVYAYSDETNFVPKQATLSYTPADVTDDSTTYFYVKVGVVATAYGDGYIWTVNTIAVETASSIPSDTADLEDPDAGAGDIHYEIGSVTAADGAVTDITQVLDDTLALIFPAIIPDGVGLPDGTAGDLLYYHATTGWTVLPAGTEGDVLVMGATYPEWETPSNC